jgi:hypothetical protein
MSRAGSSLPLVSAVEQVYRYAHPSAVGLGGGRDLLLATSGGRTIDGPVEHPRFFDGFLGHAEQMATGLLAVARVARTRFYVPPGMLAAVLRAADPVVTSNGDRLRFESFSACCGVHARLDVLPGALDGPALATGTTNVDFNPPMRQALAGIGGLDPLHLSVGEEVTVTTLDESVTEQRVPLPERWLKGFAEVQVAGSAMRPVLDVPVIEARRFIGSLPRATGARTAPVWAVPAGRGLRLTGRPGRDAVCLAGPERLRVLEPLLRFATRLRAYAPTGSGTTASAWELQLYDARLTVTLSPEVSRGFSGEGGVLRDLADPRSADDALLVSALLAFEPRIDVADLARQAGLEEERVLRALTRLGAAGRVGFDNAEEAWFHRELPYDPGALEAMHPRLRDALDLVAAGAVEVSEDAATVRSGDVQYVLRRTSDGWRCSCPWFGKHRDSRGPCKHVLAVEEVARV